MTYEKVMEKVKSESNIQDCFSYLKDRPTQEPNALTESAMLEAEHIAHDVRVKQYSVEEALLELKK